jgi:hypothetical protein
MVSTSSLNSKIAGRLSKDHEQATSVVEFVERQGRGGRLAHGGLRGLTRPGLQIRADAILTRKFETHRTRTAPGSLTNIRMYDA